MKQSLFRTSLLVALLFLGDVSAAVLSGRVVAISDGDTLTVLDASKAQHKIRLSGIDAPEKAQPFGQRSKESLSSLAFGKEVLVETSKKDRYGREVGKVLVDGLDANLEQIKRGMAWHYKAYQREQPAQDRDTYSDAEEEARRGGVGLWKDERPVPPWEYRHTKRE